LKWRSLLYDLEPDFASETKRQSVLVQSDRIGSPPNLKTVRDGDGLHRYMGFWFRRPPMSLPLPACGTDRLTESGMATLANGIRAGHV
jgi:hypothetical protein